MSELADWPRAATFHRDAAITSCVELIDQVWGKSFSRGENLMSKKAAGHHKKASEHLTHAAHHHGEAAKHHEAGHHETAAHHAHIASGHAIHARGYAEEAVKAHVEAYGKK
jgi:hypothetical protein